MLWEQVLRLDVSNNVPLQDFVFLRAELVLQIVDLCRTDQTSAVQLSRIFVTVRPNWFRSHQKRKAAALRTRSAYGPVENMEKEATLTAKRHLAKENDAHSCR